MLIHYRSLVKVPGVLLLLAAMVLSCAAAPQLFEINLEPGRSSYTVTAPESGTYWFVTESRAKVPVGQRHFAKVCWDNGVIQNRRLLEYNKTHAQIALDRVVLEKNKPRQLTITFNDDEVVVEKLIFRPFKKVRVPAEARKYRSPITPPKRHPRVMVDPASLTRIRRDARVGDNSADWEAISQVALAPYPLKFDAKTELLPDNDAVAAYAAKALYYLVTGDQKIGRDAVKLARTYLENVSFGNGEGTCRVVGETIYCAALVYDWCYGLLTPQDKKALCDRMLFMAVEMEVGWPPFKQSAGAGHGNEAQLSRDLLSMAIAIYDEDPEPFHYVMYQMLENFKPIKQFILVSGRHDQGSSYGQYRSTWDFYAALQFRRTFGVDVLPREAAVLPYYFFYMRMPDGRMLPEGDSGWVWNGKYKALKEEILMIGNALYPDPEFKAELLRGGAERPLLNKLLFLLTNDPRQAVRDRMAELPLTRIFKEPLPGLVARTGWNIGQDSDDAQVVLNGAGYQFRNHQHLDMGSFQIFYRTNLAAQLSQYKYYGVPYDNNIAKRSALHSLMRFVDPDQKAWQVRPPDKVFLNTGSADVESWVAPPNLKFLQENIDRYRVGGVNRIGCGPHDFRPVYSFLQSDLTKLFTGRVNAFTRSFVFFNQESADRPGTLLVLDRFATASPKIKPIFQLTSIDRPEWDGKQLVVRGKLYNKTGQLTLTPLIPTKVDAAIMTEKDAHTFEGVHIDARQPDRREAKGSRTELTGPGGVYLNAIQIHDPGLPALPVKAQTHGARISVMLERSRPDADAYQADFGSLLTPDAKAFTITVPADRTRLLVLDLAPGNWQVTGPGVDGTAAVDGNGHLFLRLDRGEYRFAPVRTAGKPLPVPAIRAAEIPAGK